jgi:prepilin-type N-terminal cleavage/methylation domain-containing protein
MQSARAVHANEPEKRSGFTLVELLVVMAIILILTALIAGGAVLALSYSRNNATETTIRTLTGPLEHQWKAIVEAAKNDVNAGRVPASVKNMAYAAGSPNNDKRTRVIWTYLRLRQAFPQNFTEALYPYLVPTGTLITATDLPPIPTYVQKLGNNGITSGSTVPGGPNWATPGASWPVESGTILTLALQQSYGGVSKLDPDLIARSASLPYSTTTLPMPVDGWQTPLVFYRWPTPLYIDPNSTAGNLIIRADFDPNTPTTAPYPGPRQTPAYDLDQSCPGGSSVVARDPLDPEGTLLDPLWNNQVTYGSHQGIYWFEQYCRPVHYVAFGSGAYAPYVSYSIPVVVSAGKDTQLGFVQSSVPNPPYPSPLLPDLMTDDGTGGSNDTIYSWRLRQGARGD